MHEVRLHMHHEGGGCALEISVTLCVKVCWCIPVLHIAHSLAVLSLVIQPWTFRTVLCRLDPSIAGDEKQSTTFLAP
jgi:hypothetical protein